MTASLGACSCGRRAISCGGEPIKAAPRGATTISGHVSQSLNLLVPALGILTADGAVDANDAVTTGFGVVTGAGAVSATGVVGAGLTAGCGLPSPELAGEATTVCTGAATGADGAAAGGDAATSGASAGLITDC